MLWMRFKFDEREKGHPKYHGVSQMAPVDFIVDMPDYVTYIEIKDPILRPEYPTQREEFLNELADGNTGPSLCTKTYQLFCLWLG